MTYDDTVRYQMMLGDLHQKLPWSYKRLCRVVTLAERSGLVTKERVAGASLVPATASSACPSPSSATMLLGTGALARCRQ